MFLGQRRACKKLDVDGVELVVEEEPEEDLRNHQQQQDNENMSRVECKREREEELTIEVLTESSNQLLRERDWNKFPRPVHLPAGQLVNWIVCRGNTIKSAP